MLTTDTILQDRYLIVRKLAQGGMGAVYQATDLRFGSTVALKENLTSGSNLARAFQREARLLNKLRHQALPFVLDYFVEDEGIFLVMQFIPGDDLGLLLKKRGVPFITKQVLQWADQLLDALEYLHEHEPPVIHRDIKPQNLKLSSRGEIILLDFGLAKGEPEFTALSAQRSVVGYTPHYAPLEQMQGLSTDPRSDLYSLAATMYKLLTDTLPPDALSRALALADNRPRPIVAASDVNPLVPAEIAEILTWAMSLDRNQRPASASEMRNALDEAKSGIEAKRTRLIGSSQGEASREFAATIAANGRASLDEQPSFVEELKDNLTIELIKIPAGTFFMGSPDDENGHGSDEGPQHNVSVSALFISRYPITQSQWRVVTQWPKVRLQLNPEPSHFKGDSLPVDSISWQEAVEFCDRLMKNTGQPYRLPSEAEWEYACRSAMTSAYHFGETITPELANYDGRVANKNEPPGLFRAQTTAVGSVGPANAFGLCDMHGNVWEWCLDLWHPNYKGAPSNGEAWETDGYGQYRVARGGAWNSDGSSCRCAARIPNAHDAGSIYIGFRVVIPDGENSPS